MHPQVGIHQIAFASESTPAFIDHCRAIGVSHMTLLTSLLMQPGGVQEAREALAAGGPRVESIVHPFAIHPDLERDSGGAAGELMQAIRIAVELKAKSIYLITGGRGSLSWEEAAERFAELIAPCLPVAQDGGLTLLVETTSPFHADRHMAHTLEDTITLADIAGIGVCIDIHPCWFEGGLRRRFNRAASILGLVQVSDYVLGDKAAPCRAVPGDGAIPLERILGDLLEEGYRGVFDLELLGPRIESEGARAATKRAAENLSDILAKLGA